MYRLCQTEVVKIVEHIKSVWSHLWRILLSPSGEWQRILKANVSTKRVEMGYLLPCILLCSMFHFVCTFLGSAVSFNWVRAFGAFLLPIIFYGVSYYLSVIAGGVLLFGSNWKNGSGGVLRILIAYSMTIYIVMDVLLTILPGMDYLIILDMYVVYLLYTGCKVFRIESKGSLSRAVAILSVVVVLLPIILHLVLNLLLPNM